MDLDLPEGATHVIVGFLCEHDPVVRGRTESRSDRITLPRAQLRHPFFAKRLAVESTPVHSAGEVKPPPDGQDDMVGVVPFASERLGGVARIEWRRPNRDTRPPPIRRKAKY